MQKDELKHVGNIVLNDVQIFIPHLSEFKQEARCCTVSFKLFEAYKMCTSKIMARRSLLEGVCQDNLEFKDQRNSCQ